MNHNDIKKSLDITGKEIQLRISSPLKDEVPSLIADSTKIKTELARKFPYDIEGYCDGKENFVHEIEKLALSQFDGAWDKMYLAARKVQAKREYLCRRLH